MRGAKKTEEKKLPEDKVIWENVLVMLREVVKFSPCIVGCRSVYLYFRAYFHEFLETYFRGHCLFNCNKILTIEFKQGLE